MPKDVSHEQWECTWITRFDTGVWTWVTQHSQIHKYGRKKNKIFIKDVKSSYIHYSIILKYKRGLMYRIKNVLRASTRLIGYKMDLAMASNI